MPLINQDIKNLVSGISQQPPLLRYPEQLEEQLNGFSSEAGGLQKRPPSIFINKLQKPLNENKHLVHFINRDESEQYVVICDGQDINIYDLQGNKKTINFKEDKSYIFTAQPRLNLKCITIADYTFILNKQMNVKMSEKVIKNVWDSQGLLVNIKSGQYGRTYRIDVNGKTIASFETPDGSDKSHTKQIATDYIVNQLASKCRDNGYTVTTGSSWLYVNKTKFVDESNKDITLRPSTTPKQQYDRFMGLRSTYKFKVFGTVSEGQQRIVFDILKRQIIIEGIADAGYDGYSHFQDKGKPMMDEINRCKADYWSVKEERFTSKWEYREHETIRYTLTYTESPKPGVVSTEKTAITSAQVFDGYNNQAAFGILRSVQKFTNLPTSAPDGFTVKVAGEQGSNTDDYYVQYRKTDEVWKECAKPGISYQFDPISMPHVLVREADGTFTFRRGEWSDRDIGDDDSNPEPTFVGQPINAIFFHRNRLGFLSGENVILSRSADFFNFWMTSATEVQDTDPIDLAVSDNTIATLYHAVPFDAELILFAEDAQFALQAPNVLSPSDAYLTPALTHFGNSLKAAPVNAGRNIYFVAERSRYTTVREYFTAADNTDSKDAQDITSHAPSYIPNGVYKIIASTVENILLYLTEGDESSMYVYKYLFIDGQRQQAAWSKWDMQGKIYGGAFIDSFLYIVVERNGWLCLEKLSFTFNTTDFTTEPYRVLLDSKIPYIIPKGSYNAQKDETTISIENIYGDTYDPKKTYSLVNPEGVYRTAEDSVIKLYGNHEGTAVTVGINYLFKIILSTIIVKTNENGSTSALTEGRLQLRQCWFNYADSGYFKVIVKTTDKSEYVYENTQRLLGTLSATLDKIPFTTGIFKFPVQSLNTNCTISLESADPQPLSLIGAGWTGNYVRRTRKY